MASKVLWQRQRCLHANVLLQAVTSTFLLDTSIDHYLYNMYVHVHKIERKKQFTSKIFSRPLFKHILLLYKIAIGLGTSNNNYKSTLLKHNKGYMYLIRRLIYCCIEWRSHEIRNDDSIYTIRNCYWWSLISILETFPWWSGVFRKRRVTSSYNGGN